MTRLIDAEALIKWINDSISQFGGTYSTDMLNMWGLFKDYLINNAPTVELPENAVNCVLTMFGKCSYNKTGCSDCEIKDKIRKALNERLQGEWIFRQGVTCSGYYKCNICREVERAEKNFCPNCGADMRGNKK